MRLLDLPNPKMVGWYGGAVGFAMTGIVTNIERQMVETISSFNEHFLTLSSDYTEKMSREERRVVRMLGLRSILRRKNPKTP